MTPGFEVSVQQQERLLHFTILVLRMNCRVQCASLAARLTRLKLTTQAGNDATSQEYADLAEEWPNIKSLEFSFLNTANSVILLAPLASVRRSPVLCCHASIALTFAECLANLPNM